MKRGLAFAACLLLSVPAIAGEIVPRGVTDPLRIDSLNPPSGTLSVTGKLSVSNDLFSSAVDAGNNATVDSPSIILRGSFDSDPGAGITPTAIDFTLVHDVLTTGPTSKVSLKFDGVEVGHITSTGALNFPKNGTGGLSQIAAIVFGGTGLNTDLIAAVDGASMRLSNNAEFRFISDEDDGATATAYLFDTAKAFTTTGGKLVSFLNNSFEKFFLDKDGGGFFNGDVGIGTETPNAPLEVVGVLPGTVGGFSSGQLHVRSSGTGVNDNAVITLHNSFGGNTQLAYFGSTSSSNQDIGIINRQEAALLLITGGTTVATLTDTELTMGVPFRHHDIVNATPAEPFACVLGTVGVEVYVEDTNDGSPGAKCACIHVSDNTFDWRRSDSSATPCPFF